MHFWYFTQHKNSGDQQPQDQRKISGNQQRQDQRKLNGNQQRQDQVLVIESFQGLMCILVLRIPSLNRFPFHTLR